jgi:uncharacterized protein (TIGR03663 family)
MRMAARTSSGHGGALADFPMLRDKIDNYKTALAQADWVPWLIVALAAFLRFLLLAIKPPHFDEGINGWFVDQVVKTGFYKYDPTNYHGPLHFYLLLVSEWLFGRNLWALRLPVVLASIGSVWLMFKFEPFVGRNVSRIAALAMAISPACVFYGRYSIHEVWLVVFSMLFILGLLGLWKFGTTNYLWCTGMGIAGMILTKETYVIHLACAALAVPVLFLSNKLDKFPKTRRARQRWDDVDLAMVIAIGTGVIVFFYSGTFFHWNGVKGLYEAYTAWFATGHEGHGHEKAWHYWINKLIVRYEWPVFAGLLLCLFYRRIKNLNLRYLAIYGVGTLAAYSIVHYKTPWCIISIIWPFFIIFGAMATKYYLATFAIYAVTLCHSLGYTIWLNYFRCTSDTEPYVYVQTYNDIFKFTKPLFALVRRSPLAYQLTGHIIRTSSYPLPWVLGDFTHVGYYEKDNLPDKVDGAFLLVQEDRIAEIEGKLHEAYYTDMLRIRAYQDESKVYFNAKVFKDVFPGRQPEFQGK